MNVHSFKSRVKVSLIITVLVMLVASAVFAAPLAASETTAAAEQESSSSLIWVVISAAAAFSFGALAAGFAISHVGAAAMGAMSEKPEIGSQALIFIALAEGLVVFGFITALMILGKV
ncbi:MAG: ATP synthase subunit C [Sphaerochaetaceae bacterium]|nr:ATP synthase subunit C [Sphaerochaetaceae bacterium]